MGLLKGILGIVVWAWNIVSFFALWKGVEVWFGVPWYLSLWGVILLGPVPILNSVLCYKGAYFGWGWSNEYALALAVGPFVLLIMFITTGTISLRIHEKLFKQKTQ